MATQEDMLLIEQLKGLAGSLRGATETFGKGQQNIINLQAQQQFGEQARQRQLADIGTQRQFVTQEREAGQAFRSEQAVLERESLEKRAALRGADIQIDIDTSTQRTLESAVGSGFLKQTDEGQDVISGRSDEQAKFAASEKINIEAASDEQFNNPKWRKAHNNKINAAIATAKQSGQPGAVSLLRTMLISGKATKEQVIGRIESFRRSLIEREVNERFKKEGTVIGSPPGVPTGAAAGFSQLAARPRQATPQEAATIRARLRKEIEAEFSGILEGGVVPTQPQQTPVSLREGVAPR